MLKKMHKPTDNNAKIIKKIAKRNAKEYSQATIN